MLGFYALVESWVISVSHLAFEITNSAAAQLETKAGVILQASHRQNTCKKNVYLFWLCEIPSKYVIPGTGKDILRKIKNWQ